MQSIKAQSPPSFAAGHWWSWGIVSAILAALALANSWFPFCWSTEMQEAVLNESSIVLAVLAVNVYLFLFLAKRTRLAVLQLAVVAALGTTTAIAGSNRAFAYEQVMWEVDGEVIAKYRSENHGAPSLTVRGTVDQQLEYVDEAFWDAAEPGDRIVKAGCSTYATLNGVRRVMVLRQRSKKE